MKRRTLSSGLVLLAICLSFLQMGYVVQTRSDRSHTVWDPARYPIVIRPSISLAQSLRFEAGSQPLVALREALERWVRVSSLVVLLGEESSRHEAARDDVNLVTIGNSRVNRNILAAALATSVRWTSGARITETDVIFNPELTWSTRETKDFQVKNFLDVALHELGHSWNLGHSTSRASVLYFRTQGFNYGFNLLTQDDRSGIQTSYPPVGLKAITGSISGRVTRNGDPVFGAFVVAVDEFGVLSANAITLPDGEYRIQNIPPGRYTLYVEPLDGPMTPRAVRGGIFDAPPSIVTDFPSQFYQNSREPSVKVASEVSGIDFEVGTGVDAAGPEFVGTSVNAFSASFATTPAEAPQGSNTHYVVAGQGVDGLPEERSIFFLGHHLETGFSVAQAISTDGNPVKWYPLTVPLETPLGEYTAFLETDQVFGVITGGLRIVPRLRFGLTFAQFAHIPGTAVSELFLVNVDRDAPTRGSITARASNGARRVVRMHPDAALGTVVDQGVALSPGGSAALRTSGGDLFIGSLRARANGCIGGTVLFQTPFGTTGVGPSVPLFTVVAPDIRSGRRVNTGLAITNLDSRPVQIYLGIQNKAGIRRGQNLMTLPGNGQISRFIREERDGESLISGLPNNFQGTVVVTANREIGVTVIRTAEGVFTTFPAVQARVRRSAHFAQFVHAGSLRSSLLLVNPSAVATADVTVQVRQSSGSPAAVTLDQQHLANGRKTFSLPPLGSEILETQGHAEVIGSVEVSSDVPVGGVVLFSSPEAGTAGVGESFPMRRMVVPVSRELGMDTGVAMVNTEDRVVKLDLLVRNSRGEITAGPLTLTLKAREQKARFPSELGFRLGPSFTGSLWIEADGLIAATAIRQAPGNLTTFPVIGLEKAITPAPR